MNSELREFLLSLGLLTRSVPVERFKVEVLKTMGRYLHFDSGIWIEGRPGDGYIYEHSRTLYNQPDEMMTSYFENAMEIDFLALAAMESPGKAIDIDSLIPRPDLKQHPIYMNHMQHFGITHSLCIAIPHEGTNVFSFISLYRAEEGDCFSELHRELAENMAPFLADAFKSTLFFTLNPGSVSDRLEAPPMAIVDKYGIIYQQTSSWNQAVSTLAGEEVQAKLPVAMMPYLEADGLHRWGPSKIKVVFMEIDLFFLQVFMESVTSQLTKAEFTVAKLYVHGQTRKTIASSLCRSEETIKIHLNNIYRKLEVNSKLALVTRLSDDPEMQL